MTWEQRELFIEKIDALADGSGKTAETTVLFSRETYSGMSATLHRLQNEGEKPRSPKEYRVLYKYHLVDVDGVQKIARRGLDTLLVAKEDLFDVIHEAHIKTGHGGRDVTYKELRRSFYNVTLRCTNIYLGLCEECQDKRFMVKHYKAIKRKRQTVSPAIQPPLAAVDLLAGGPPAKMTRTRKTRDKMTRTETRDKMIQTDTQGNMIQTRDLGGDPSEDGFRGDKHSIWVQTVSPTIQPPDEMIGIHLKTEDFGGDPVKDEFIESEDPTYSPFPNPETEEIGFDEENHGSPVTDTITIEQLQAQLKYERRCRMLAEKELRELKEMMKLIPEMNTLMMQMRHTSHELCVTLDHVRHGSDGEVPTQSNDESI